MKTRRSTRFGPRRGVSEVLGALMLIIVVVVAAASLAAFLSRAQEDAQARQSLLTSVKDENLQVQDPLFSPQAGAVWKSLTVSVRNLNTAQSGVWQVQVNGQWLPSWTEVSPSNATLQRGSSSGVALVVPAAATVRLYLPLYWSGIAVLDNQSVKVTVMSSSGSFFTSVFLPPVPVFGSTIATASYGQETRDVVQLDGSGSYSVNASIDGYSWAVTVPASSCTLAGLASDNITATLTGETVKYLPEALFTPAQLGDDAPSSYGACITGPVSVALTVTDSDGLRSTSAPMVVSSEDQAIAPAVTVACQDSCLAGGSVVQMYVGDIFGGQVRGAVVRFSNVTVTGQNITGATVHVAPLPSANQGCMSPGYDCFTTAFSCTGSGYVEFYYSDLPPVTKQLSCSGAQPPGP